MSRSAKEVALVEEAFPEKEFYLEEFRSRTLCFAAPLADCERPGGFSDLGGVVRELVANQTRVILLLGFPTGRRSAEAWLARAQRRLQPYLLSEATIRRFPRVRGRHSIKPSFVSLAGSEPGGAAATVEQVWGVLRRRPLFVGLVEQDRLLGFARRLATRLRVHKLVFLEALGGIATLSSGPLSFLDASVLEAMLRTGEAEWAGFAGRRPTLEAVHRALEGGVRAVNLCSVHGVSTELFTYEGSGTLFTLEDYCKVDRLGIDDFDAVERLIERGQRDGYLKPRTPAERARLLVNGYGATIGFRHLAGICALETEPYRADRAGEVAALYTISRFKGEGVGGRLIQRVVNDAVRMGLRYVFACTTDTHAAAFFERVGFRPVAPEDVPAEKWQDYDEERRERLRVLRRDLSRSAEEDELGSWEGPCGES